MTPSPEPADPADPVSPLTAEQEDEIAALLADAVGQGPVAPPPSDVVSRLDDVLARLVEERSADRSPGESARGKAAAPAHPGAPPAGGATVVPLEPRRRRLPRALLAAAAVVVGGYAVGDAVLDGSGAGDALQSGSADAGGSTAGGGGESAAQGERLSAGRGDLAAEDMMALAPVVRRDHLVADVDRVVRRFGRLPAAADPDGATAEGQGGPVDETPDCPVPRLTDEQRLYYVRFQGEPAGLVLGPRREGRVDATVYSCLTGGVELSRPVPAP